MTIILLFVALSAAGSCNFNLTYNAMCVISRYYCMGQAIVSSAFNAMFMKAMHGNYIACTVKIFPKSLTKKKRRGFPALQVLLPLSLAIWVKKR